jgi:type I restriction enzyme S subunit
MDDIEYIVLSDSSEVNPPTDLHGLDGNTTVSFIPMADVSESGEWINQQARPLKDVRNGYTCFQEGDILFAKITPCMENGKGAHAVNLLNGIGFGTTEFHVLRAKSRVHSRFIYHWIMNEELRRKAEARMTGSAGQRRVPASFLGEFKVPFPPLPEQCRIAEILDTIGEAIQKTEALISKLKAMKQCLLHDLLTRGLDKNGKLRDPKAHPEQFKDSPLGRIPREWGVVSIGEIASYVGSGLTPRGGSEVYKISGIMFIRSQNVTFEGLKLEDIAFIDSKTHEQMRRSEVFAYDVLLNITGASIGRCCPLSEGLGPTNVNQHVCAIRLPNPYREDAFYLSSILASHIGQHQIDVLNAGGNREGLNYQQLRSFVIPWPEKDERTKAANIIVAHDARIRAEEQYRDKLKLQKKGLMHDLLTIKVRVKV